MKRLVVVGLLLVASSARADGFAELVGGIALPAGNDDWKNLVGTSPKVGGRIGGVSGDEEGTLGGMLGVDWTPENLNNGGGSFGIGSTDGSVNRFRVIASAVFHHRLTPRISVSARAGAGIDIAHASIDVTVLGSTSSSSDTDVGYAFDFGVGLWFDVGAHVRADAMKLGVELGVPIGHHDKAAKQNGDIPFQYTDVDVDLLLAVRF